METIHLTPSQLMVLLIIHQQRFPDTVVLAGDEFSYDIRHLLKQDLVAYDGTHRLTPFGAERVRQALEGL